MHKKLQIEYWPLSRLVPYARNPRVNDKAVAKMIASITEYGFSVPCLARSNGEVVDGHLRLKAAMAMQLAEVPVIVCDGWTEAQVKAFRLMVNRSVTWADWDLEALTAEFMDLKALDFDLVQTGFDIAEINRFTIAPNPAEDEVPPVPEAPVTITGDLWLLGEHRLVCGDATNADDVSKLLNGSKADTMWTDPPFGVSYVGKTDRALTIQNDGSTGLRAMLDGFLYVASDAIAPSSPFYIAHPPGAQYLVFGNAVTDAGWRIHQNLVWVKDSMVLGHSDYHFQHEPIIYGFTPGEGRPGRGNHIGTRWCGDHCQVSIFQVPRPKRSEEHPTMKPVELIRRCLMNSTPARGLVYDPFAGSGSTLIACEEIGYKGRMIDIDCAYCDVIITRWQNLTGKQAIHDATGATFEHVQHGRRMAAEDALKEEALSHDHEA